MRYHAHMRSRLGVRAIRQSVSVYLRRGASPIDRLVTAGRTTMPEGDLLELGTPPMVARSRRLSRALQEQRADRD